RRFWFWLWFRRRLFFGALENDFSGWFFDNLTVDFSPLDFFAVLGDDLVGHAGGAVDTFGLSLGFPFVERIIILAGGFVLDGLFFSDLGLFHDRDGDCGVIVEGGIKGRRDFVVFPEAHPSVIQHLLDGLTGGQDFFGVICDGNFDGPWQVDLVGTQWRDR